MYEFDAHMHGYTAYRFMVTQVPCCTERVHVCADLVHILGAAVWTGQLRLRVASAR